jgi:tripartite-type tricarboxylate transporter receptor subunit TctC
MKRFYAIILAALLGLSLPGWKNQMQAAERYPVKPITLIVPVEAGSDADLLARPIAQKASTILGQPIIVVNKPGAGMTIGFREIHAAKPDGYTIGLATGPIITNKLQGLMPYDYRDYTIMGQYAIYIPIIVGSTKTQRPFKTIEDAISFAKSHPGEVSAATSGVGYLWWLATVAFQEVAGIKLNIIPQAGAGAFAIAQVAGGHTDLGVVALASAKSQIDAGNARFLAVIGPKRAPGYENIPILREVGCDVSIESPHVVIGPPKMPKDFADQLTRAFEKAATDPEYQKFVIERNGIPLYLPPEKVHQSLDEQRKIFRTIMEKAGILKEN